MTAADTFKVWESLCSMGCINSIFASDRDVSWSWTANPERLQNGALRGRIYSHRKGELMKDVGGFKINPDGTIAAAPAAFLEVLEIEGARQAVALTPLAAQEQRRATAFSTDDIEDAAPAFTDEEKSEMYYIGNGCSAVMPCGTIISGDES